MKVILRVSLQYIPSFVDAAAVKFKRNGTGTVDWSGVSADGNAIRDWVWSASTRALVDDFLTKLFNQINWSTIDGVEVGRQPESPIPQLGQDIDRVFEPVVGEPVGVVAEEHQGTASR